MKKKLELSDEELKEKFRVQLVDDIHISDLGHDLFFPKNKEDPVYYLPGRTLIKDFIFLASDKKGRQLLTLQNGFAAIKTLGVESIPVLVKRLNEINVIWENRPDKNSPGSVQPLADLIKKHKQENPLLVQIETLILAQFEKIKFKDSTKSEDIVTQLKGTSLRLVEKIINALQLDVESKEEVYKKFLELPEVLAQLKKQKEEENKNKASLKRQEPSTNKTPIDDMQAGLTEKRE